jgi:DNA-binding CsgD family transcriptional regulator
LDDRLWEPFLTDLAQSFGSDQALMVSVDSVPLPDPMITTVGMDMDVVTKWAGSREHVDVWYRAIQTKNQDMAYRGLELCSRSVLHRSAFYADSLRALDIEHTLGGISVETAHRRWAFAIYRSRCTGPFTVDEKSRYELLIPHFRRAIQIRQKLARSASRNLTTRDALDKLPFGVVALDERAQVLWANRKADEIFTACDGITVRYGRINFWEYSRQNDFDRSVHEASRVAGHQGLDIGSAVTATRPSGMRAYQLSISPLNRRTNEATLIKDGACLIFIHDPEQPKTMSAGLIRSLYGLTAAEARFCVALFEKGSLSAASSSLDVSRNTAKTHLASIFEKMGVTSQAQLLQALALGVAGR